MHVKVKSHSTFLHMRLVSPSLMEKKAAWYVWNFENKNIVTVLPVCLFDAEQHVISSSQLNKMFWLVIWLILVNYYWLIIQISLHAHSGCSNSPLPQCNVSIILQDQVDYEPIQLNTTITLFIKDNRRRFGVFIVNFEHMSHLFLVFLLLILDKQMLAGMFM